MTTGAPSHCAAHPVVNTIPDGEESIAVVFALESVIQFSQHLTGLPHIGTGECTRTDHIGHGDRKQRGIQPVPRDVDQVKCEVIFVHPVVTDRVAAECGGRAVAPIHRDWPVHRRGDAVSHVLEAGGEFCPHPLGAETLQQGFGVL